MKLTELINFLELKSYVMADDAEQSEITAAYCGDLLSDVMAHAPANSVWFTIQSHLNIIAVAQLRDISCIVMVNGIQPDPQTIDKATMLGITICGSDDMSADLCMKLAGQLG